MFCICHSTGDIADFDDDDKIGKEDLEEVINRLTGSKRQDEHDGQLSNRQQDEQRLSKKEMEDLIFNVSAKFTLDLVADWLMLRFCVALKFVNASVKLLVI